MHIIAYLLSFGIVGYTLSISAAGAGLSIAAYWDLISLLLVIVAPYFLLAGKSKSFDFKKIDHQEWGNLSVKFAYIGVLMGLIMLLGGMAVPPEPGVDPMAKIGGSIAVALICLLYALVFKYMVVYLCDCDSHK
ncbi:MAG: hypothetical protein H8E72_07480 [Candidatus Marinimicrobia bacterium]|nr:hypothetical protein [Candidatus Neomarinimicrobiota bacterium]